MGLGLKWARGRNRADLEVHAVHAARPQPQLPHPFGPPPPPPPPHPPHTRTYSTVVAISIRMANFGWAHPNRVVSQAVFKNLRPGIQSLERSAKCVPQIRFKKQPPKNVGGRLEAGFPLVRASLRVP